MYGQLFYYDGQTLHFGKFKDGESYDLILGSNLEDFDFQVNVQPLDFETISYEYLSDQINKNDSSSIALAKLNTIEEHVADTSSAFFEKSSQNPVYQNIADSAALNTFNTNKKEAIASDLLQLSGSAIDARLRLGDMVNIKTPRFSDGKKNELGLFKIIKITHQLQGNGSYQNRFHASSGNLENKLLDQQINIPFCDPQTAKVIENVDPDGLGRIRVQFIWQKDQEMTPWINVLQAYSGDKRGLLFTPEIDDLVMVGFHFGHPDRPFVLGSVYPGTGSAFKNEDNNVKVIKTRDGHRVVFQDGEKGSVGISTKGKKNEIILSIEDDGSIKIETEGFLQLKGENITVEANSELILKGDTINIESGQATQISAGTDLKLEGTASAEMKGATAKVEADAQLELKAGAQLSADGGAMTEIKGGMVMIN